ncbi:hypothetical protein C0J52_07657 [Blattella germanica]|nr:hypothetical protein C0J52_07657 [Blattella germanica]
MEEQRSREGLLALSEDGDGGPSAVYRMYISMEELLDKHYFAIQTNPGEQFYLFTSLAAWLIRKTGRQFEQPQEYDDPNSTISNARDWRAHLEQMQKHRSGIDEALVTTKGQLDKLQSEISLTLEKIGSREKFLNSQLEALLVQYRALQLIVTPLVNIKKAMSQVKSEISVMDVRIGVLEHSLLQARLRDKNQLQQDMNAPLHVLV